VAAVAAYASYEHQRAFALRGGTDPTGASLWPLSVDGLLVLATIGLLKPAGGSSRRARYTVRLAFILGIAVSLAANVAAAPRLAWQPVLVAGWPPVALLLSVELLAHGPAKRGPEVAARSRRAQPTPGPPVREREEPDVSETETRSRRTGNGRSRDNPNAEQIMWAHYRHQLAAGHTPTGADLDRAAGTNNYGRAALARWRTTGRIPDTPAPPGTAGQR
jgi:hypothetical protein